MQAGGAEQTEDETPRFRNRLQGAAVRGRPPQASGGSAAIARPGGCIAEASGIGRPATRRWRERLRAVPSRRDRGWSESSHQPTEIPACAGRCSAEQAATPLALVHWTDDGQRTDPRPLLKEPATAPVIESRVGRGRRSSHFSPLAAVSHRQPPNARQPMSRVIG
jgi:hypothetical protein